MEKKRWLLVALAAAWLVVSLSVAGAEPPAARSAVVAQEERAWSDAGIPGVSIAVVERDEASGASHFFLRYAKGFVAPLHHHSPDHYVTTVTGHLILIVDGEERHLAPGSYFALLDGAPHGARCEGDEDCVMFIDARGPWDVVLEPPAE